MREAKSFVTFVTTKLNIYNYMNINIKIKKKTVTNEHKFTCYRLVTICYPFIFI